MKFVKELLRGLLLCFLLTSVVIETESAVFDFDGDGKTDPLVLRQPPNGNLIWYVLRSCFKLRIRAIHLVDDKIADLIEKRFVQSEMLPTVIDSAPHYFPKYIIAAFVAGQNAVSDRERGRTRVVGDNAAGVLLALGKVFVDTHKEKNIIVLSRQH